MTQNNRTVSLFCAAALSMVALVGETNAANMQVDATIVGACTISTQTLNFGSYVNAQNTDKPGEGSVGYDCVSGLNITLNLSLGSLGSGTQRFMAGGGAGLGQVLEYQLYQDSGRSVFWGSGLEGLNVNPTPGGGVANVPVYGTIFKDQTKVPANYADVVVLTLTINS